MDLFAEILRAAKTSNYNRALAAKLSHHEGHESILNYPIVCVLSVALPVI